MADLGEPVWTEIRNDARNGATWWDWYCEPPPDGAEYEVVRDDDDEWRGGYPVRRIFEVRITAPFVAADRAEPPPRRYSFTRDRLIEAISHLEAYPATAGPGQRVFIPAESMADAIIEALEGNDG